jgi:hypothetical protein
MRKIKTCQVPAEDPLFGQHHQNVTVFHCGWITPQRSLPITTAAACPCSHATAAPQRAQSNDFFPAAAEKDIV